MVEDAEGSRSESYLSVVLTPRLKLKILQKLKSLLNILITSLFQVCMNGSIDTAILTWLPHLVWHENVTKRFCPNLLLVCLQRIIEIFNLFCICPPFTAKFFILLSKVSKDIILH